MNFLLLPMPDSFGHMPAICVRMRNGALTSLAGNVDPHHKVAVADLIELCTLCPPCDLMCRGERALRNVSPQTQLTLYHNGIALGSVAPEAELRVPLAIVAGALGT